MLSTARIKSTTLSNEGWFNRKSLLNLMNEVLLLLALIARHESKATQALVEQWLQNILRTVSLCFDSGSPESMGCLAKFIRSGKEGWVAFEEEDWAVLHNILVPSFTGTTAERKSRCLNELQHFIATASLNKKSPKPNDIMAAGIHQLLFQEQLTAYLNSFHASPKKAEEMSKLTKAVTVLIIYFLKAVGMALTPLAVLRKDNKYYSHLKSGKQIQTVTTRLRDAAVGVADACRQTVFLRKNQTDIERQALTVVNAASQLAIEFTLKSSERSLKLVKERLAAKKKALGEASEKASGLQKEIKKLRSENQQLKQQLKIEANLLEALRQEFVTRNKEALHLREEIQQVKTETSGVKNELLRLQSLMEQEQSRQKAQVKNFDKELTRYSKTPSKRLKP
ncbi:hypothetical protein [Legionella taurinensis]|nr:hypothetical protein [Legionella taurinensis]MDX1837909.1 hypothetical protein [Legionella taurinensis]STY25069.1 Uncharacterised protein [Legionella taurinensis]